VTEDRGTYLLVTLSKNRAIPTIGANGFIGLKCHLTKLDASYYFDIDAVYELVQVGINKIAMVKTGVIHLHARSTHEFVRKGYRRIRDYYMFRSARKYPWSTARLGILKFSLFSITVIPMMFESIRGYRKKPDTAWFFHPFGSLLILLTYSLGFIRVNSARGMWSERTRKINL
jgi:hypothetical protein